MRAAIYSRFSTDLQNPRSAADQTKACRSIAEANGWQVVEVYEDAGLTGAFDHQRPSYRRMVADAKSRRFDAVLCEAPDRLARRLADLAALSDQLTYYNISIHTLQYGLLTPMHIAMLGMMSQMTLSDIRAKTRRGLRAVAEDGRSAGGLCYGYRVVHRDHGRRGGRTTEPHEAAVIVRIFKQYAAGVRGGSVLRYSVTAPLSGFPDG